MIHVVAVITAKSGKRDAILKMGTDPIFLI